MAVALSRFAGDPHNCQEARAYDLIAGITAEQGLASSELIRQLE